MNTRDTVSIIASVSDWFHLREASRLFSTYDICYKREATMETYPRYNVKIWLDYKSYREYDFDYLGNFTKFQVVNGAITGVCVAINHRQGDSSSLEMMFGLGHEILVPGRGKGRIFYSDTTDDISNTWNAEMQHRLLHSAVVCVVGLSVKWVVGEMTDGSRLVLPQSMATDFRKSAQKISAGPLDTPDMYKSWASRLLS